MATISERLRIRALARVTLKSPRLLDKNDAALDHEAAAAIDALTAALDGMLPMVKRHAEPEYLAAVAALSLARKGG